MRVEELSKLLLETDPAAVLLPAAALVRVIKNVTGVPWSVWRVPHSRCFLVDRHTLFKYVEQDELDLPPDHQLPTTVLLLERPSNERLASPRGDLLLRYWRVLFHIAVHREMEQKLTSPMEVRRRIERLGRAAFEEARNVLTHDGHLDPKADDRAAFIEFASFYLELRHFAWNLIPVYFPSLPPTEQVDALLAEDVDAKELAKRTRLKGAPDPNPKTDDQSDESHDYYYRLERAARRAAGLGDTVGAAILHTRAARVAPAALTEPAHAAAVKDIHKLVSRLQKALDLDDATSETWRQTLPALLDKADQGNRTVEAAILYDLQRACLDHEQKIYTLDVIEWLRSAGHKSIRRELDSQRYVRVPAHLRMAARRLTAARLSDSDRQALAGLLRAAQDKAEERLRKRFRPVLTDALHDAGMRPNSLAEDAALAKTVEELLDKISVSGILTFADLRDAISRGQVKLPDLSGPDEYISGDLLLRLDRRLATLLDGVYRRSEFYTRWLERATSLAFGTESGRWVTRNVFLPFGGAFLLAQFAWLLVYELGYRTAPHAEAVLLQTVSPASAPIGDAIESATVEISQPPGGMDFLTSGWNASPWFHIGWLLLAIFFLALVQSQQLRLRLANAWRTVYRIARTLFWDLPLRIWSHPVVRSLRNSLILKLAARALRVILRAAVMSLLLFIAFDVLWNSGLETRLITILAAGMLAYSRVGEEVESLLLQHLTDLIEAVRRGLIPGLIRWVAETFRHFIDTVEWLLARGDDWLRLRGGGNALAVVARAMAGLFWFPFAFVVRFYIVVLIEPMINPIKLPLSLLFAKFVYPLLALAGVFEIRRPSEVAWYDFAAYSVKVAGLETFNTVMPYWLAFGFLVGTFWLLPDAVTYLFWETRENWRLYRANRPRTLKAVPVGPHGETVAGLLRPGFHSGTVPRLYAKLRAAERRGASAGIWQEARSHREALREVAAAVSRFVNREFIVLLNSAQYLQDKKLSIGHIHIGTNRIRIELKLDNDNRVAAIEWEERSGWLVAGWADVGWVVDLPNQCAKLLGYTLAYLYKRAGIDLVREQVQSELPPSAKSFDVVPAGLMVWYGLEGCAPVLYDIAHRADDLRPRSFDNLGLVPGPALNADRLVFARMRLTWTGWLEVWRSHTANERLHDEKMTVSVPNVIPHPIDFGPPDLAGLMLPRVINSSNATESSTISNGNGVPRLNQVPESGPII